MTPTPYISKSICFQISCSYNTIFFFLKNVKNIHTTSWPLFYFRWKLPFVLCTWCQQNFAHDQQKLSLPSQQIFNDRAQKCSRNPFLEDSFSPLVGDEEGVVIFPLLGQERSARVSSVAGAKGHPHTSPLTAGLSTCSCFSSPVSCLVASHPEQII